MEVGAIRQFIMHLWKLYANQASRAAKAKIIDAVVITLQCHRKSAIRLLSGSTAPELRRKSGNRKPKYNQEHEKWLVRIWRSMGKICSERIVAALEDWIPALKLKLGLPQRIAEKLLEMSASTMDRKLARYRSCDRRKQNTGTVRSLYTAIPIKPLGITVTGPGFVEIDSVAHCGGDMSGTFAWTISATDLATNMTFSRAVFGKSAEAVTAALLELENCFPFPIYTFWFDNGTEFINELVFETFANRQDFPIRIERSRPYKKNDQAYIEEKNWTHVRQLFGYVRIESKKAVAIMNKIYEKAWCPLHNFYLPQSKTIEKWRIGAKVRRKVDKPKTPYLRLLESSTLSEQQSQSLTRKRNNQDPLDLKRELDLLFVDLRKEIGSRVLLMPRRFSEGLCLMNTEEAS
jgi:hypothetical protein